VTVFFSLLPTSRQYVQCVLFIVSGIVLYVYFMVQKVGGKYVHCIFNTVWFIGSAENNTVTVFFSLLPTSRQYVQCVLFIVGGIVQYVYFMVQKVGGKYVYLNLTLLLYT
jgi:uncharacterized membrane protein (UPF0136 family)